MRCKIITISILFGIAGCARTEDGTDNRIVHYATDVPAAEVVNGIAVPQALLDAFARGRAWDLAKPEQRENALKELTDYILLAQEAQREQLPAAPEFQADVEIARLQAMANATMLAFQHQATLSDEVLKSEYAHQVERAGKYDYDFSQLLFADEDEALKATDAVIAGTPFPKVFDAWKDKAKQAKVFNRVRLDQVPEALGKALAEMKNDETTKVPVKTQFGWHVVHLDIANPFSPPPFDQIKDGMRRTLLQKLAQERLQKLKEQAQIVYPDGAVPIPAKVDKAETKADAMDSNASAVGKQN